MLVFDAAFIVCASSAVILSGLAKGGFAGVGALAMPIMVLGVPPLAAAAILLPILVVQDVVGVASFRKTWDRVALGAVIPGMACGVLFGYIFATQVSEVAVLAMVGAIASLFGARGLWRELYGGAMLPSSSPPWVGTIFGMASGFSSQIAHAGALPFHIWLIPRRLERDSFVGTSAIAFAFLNGIKVPAYAALGQFTTDNLTVSAFLLPLAFISTWWGVWLVRRTNAVRYYRIIYGLMILLGAKLMIDAIISKL